MFSVHKYTLQMVQNQTLSLPKMHKILTAQMQGDQLMLWVWLEVNAEYEIEREIYICGTGRVAPLLADYIATVQAGPLVIHIFVKDNV
jgi:hypothetical protein